MPEPFFTNLAIQQFWEDMIMGLPAAHSKAAQFILKRLDDKGDCPSVRTPERTPLENISLTDHTLRVARNIGKSAVPGTPLYSCAVIAALGHDISKLPGILPRNHFAKILHARKSANYLESWLHDFLNDREVELRYETIFHHHDMEKKTSLIEQLKAADNAARTEEAIHLGIEILKMGYNPETGEFIPTREEEPSIERYTVTSQKLPPDPDAERIDWFDADEFLAALKPKVNHLDFYTWGPEAISTNNDICYFTQDVIYNTFKELAHAKKWHPMELIDNTAVNPQRRINLYEHIRTQLPHEI